MNVSERNYVSATHWTAILDNVGVPCSSRVFRYLADAPRSEISEAF